VVDAIIVRVILSDNRHILVIYVFI